MRNIKDFQARYDRWKKGERYWDIRGVDLPRYDTGDKNTVVTDDGSVFNVDTSAIGARNLEVTTPEVEVVSQKPLYLKKRDQLLNNIAYNPGEIRQGKNHSTLDNIRTFLSNYRNNSIARNVEQSIEDWQHHKTPMQAAFDNFAYMNPYTATIAAGSNLLSDRGIRRTVNLAKNGQYRSASLSGLGDLLDASMLLYGGRHIKNNGIFDVAKLFENTRFGNYLRNKIISNELNRNIVNLDGIGGTLPYKRIEIPQKQGNGRYQFDSPTYQIYTGPKHDISEIINADGSVNLRNLLNIQNEALRNIPGGTIARHRLENQKWHPTDWNTFLHTRDVYKRALENKYPQEALFPALMHDFGKMWAGDGHGHYGASIIQQIFPKASKEQIQAIYGHMDINPVAPLTRLVKGVDIKEPNEFRYLQKPLNHHLQGEDAVKMFKEYGGTPIPEGSINGDQLRRYVMEARERYGLMNNTNISDEEIAQALYKHTNELGKGNVAINSQGEPQLLFRGDTKPYTKLKVNHNQLGKSDTEDNVLGTIFLDRTGIGEGWGPDRYMYLVNQDNKVMAPYRNGIETESFTTLQPKFKPDYVIPFEEKGFVDDFDVSYPYYKHDGRYGVISGSKISSEAFADGYTNQLNGFVVRTPHERDITNEVLTNGMSRPPKVGEEFQWRVPHTTDISSASRETRILQNKAIVKDAQQKNQGLLRSKAGSPYRDEHDKYDYLVVPDFNARNVKHILPYDLRIPRNWSDPNIFRIVAPIGMSLPFLNNFRNKVNYEKER